MKILVCYDGSNVAQDALKLARYHAEVFGGSLFIVKALPQSHELGYEEIQREEHSLQGVVKDILDTSDIAYEAQVIVTNLTPGEEIVDFAHRNEIDEVVIGIRKRSKVGKLVFGSTAQYVIINADCPVVSIK
ncbi:MAG: universal stress protein [Desulfobacterales bacterium]|jgi:nucleotide-binding universal stress UspA family protein